MKSYAVVKIVRDYLIDVDELKRTIRSQHSFFIHSGKPHTLEQLKYAYDSLLKQVENLDKQFGDEELYPEYPEGTRVITKFDDIKGIVEADYGHKIRMRYDSMSEGQSVTIHKNAVNKLK